MLFWLLMVKLPCFLDQFVLFMQSCKLPTNWISHFRPWECTLQRSLKPLYMPLGPTRGENLFFLGLIHSRISDFKDLSTLTTVTDHQSNKICRCWDSFRYPRLVQYAGIENHVQKYIVKQQIFFPRLLQKGKTIVFVLPLALHTSPCHAATLTKFGQRRYNNGYQTYPLVESFFGEYVLEWM